MKAIAILCALTVCMMPDPGAAEELRVEALRNGTRGRLLPELRVREIVDHGERRIVLLSTITIPMSGLSMFNPFGDEKTGRCYRVSIIDAKGTVLRDVVPATSVQQNPPAPGLWMRVTRGGVIGRSHELPSDAFNGLPAGQYSLIVLIHRRMLHAPPDGYPFSSRGEPWDDTWKSSAEDLPQCCSAPVKITIDAQGVCQFPDIEPFQVIDIDATVDQKRDLSISMRLVNPEDAWLVLPEMNMFFLSHERPAMEVVTQEDGSPFQRHFRPPGGTSGVGSMSEKYAVYVPRNGIVGGVLPYAGTLEAGNYRVAVQVNQSIFRDKLFVNGQKIIRRRADWPVAFQSNPRVVMVSGE